MRPFAQHCFHNLRSTLLSGLWVGFGAALTYGVGFAVYAIARSSARIGASLALGEGLVGTLTANAFALLVACLVFTCLLGLIAAISTSITWVLVYGLTKWLNPQRSARRAIWIGLFTTGLPASALLLTVQYGLGSYFAALWPTGYLFWVGVPCLILVGGTTWLTWQAADYSSGHQARPFHAAA